MGTPDQGVVALWASVASVAVVLGTLLYSLRAEKKRPADTDDDH